MNNLFLNESEQIIFNEQIFECSIGIMRLNY